MTRTVAIAITLLALSGSAIADPRAEQLYHEGQAAFDANRFDDAVAAWRQSYDLSGAPGLLFNLAQAYRLRGAKGDCASAAATYRKFIADDPSSPQRATAERFAEETERCAATERPPEPSPPVVVPPPPPSIAPVSTPPTPRDDRPRTKRLAGIGIAAGGGILVGVGLYFGRRASSLGDEVTAACATSCDWGVVGAKEDRGRAAERNQYLFTGLGAVAVIGGGVLYWLGMRESRASIAIAPTPGGTAVTWGGRW